jgi:hypothetical protein
MSTTATTLRPVAQTATTADDDSAARLTAYRARVDIVRRSYRRRACHNEIAANGLSLLLVAAGAAVGLSPLLQGFRDLTAVLGVAVILLEGVTRVLRPALRAARAGRVARKLEREFRLYDVCGRGYRCGGPEADAAFVAAVERILEQADAAEEHDETGASNAPAGPRKAG